MSKKQCSVVLVLSLGLMPLLGLVPQLEDAQHRGVTVDPNGRSGAES